jgi:hypothetical protein
MMATVSSGRGGSICTYGIEIDAAGIPQESEEHGNVVVDRDHIPEFLLAVLVQETYDPVYAPGVENLQGGLDAGPHRALG